MLSSLEESNSMLRIIEPSFVRAQRKSLKLSIIATIRRRLVRSRNRLKGQESPAMGAPKRLQASKSIEINHMIRYLPKSLKKKLLKSIVA